VRKIEIVLCCFVASCANAQVSGNRTFDFLRIPAQTRIAALGGVNVSLADRDVGFFLSNPSLAGDTLNGVASAAYQFYLANTGHALFSYSHDFKNVGQLLFGIQHINYGILQGYDESGLETTDFHSGETAIMVGKNHQIGNFRIGATLKGVFSSVAGYRANAVMLDIGGIFKHPQHDLTIGLAIKNLGLVLSDYSKSSASSIPFDVQAGVTLKPQYMPARFSLAAYNLLQSGLLNEDPSIDAARPALVKRMLSHVNLGVEILLHRNFNVLFGYNYLMHEALKFQTGGGGSGICYGFSVWAKPVEFVFSRSGYFAGNAGYSFTLSTNINKLLKRR
jgi:hypothetical protein